MNQLGLSNIAKKINLSTIEFANFVNDTPQALNSLKKTNPTKYEISTLGITAKALGLSYDDLVPVGSIKSSEYYIDKLMDFYKVPNSTQLSDKINISKQGISEWRSRNSVSAIKKKCHELEIYTDIFESKDAEKDKNHISIDSFTKDTQKLLDSIILSVNNDVEKIELFNFCLSEFIEKIERN